jgi:apolipoprotein N-acyltransferase
MKAFKLGLLAGCAHYLTLIYWIIFVLQHYGGLNIFVSILALILLSLYLALFPALFSLLYSFLGRGPFSAVKVSCLWVALEFVRGKALTGFPWCLLGYSQYNHLGLIQISDLTGVYGVSFLILLSNVLIFKLVSALISTRVFTRPLNGKSYSKTAQTGEVIIILFLFLSGLYYGALRLEEKASSEKKPFRAAIIQGNIDQSIKWAPEYQESTIQTYLRLTRNVSSYKPEIIVWPETAVPFFFQRRGKFAQRVAQIPSETEAYLLFGSPAYRRADKKTTFFNRAYLISPDGLVAYYDKIHLVPFGEYVPLKKYLPFINRLVQAVGDFSSGKSTHPLKLDNLSSGILICFEVIFPELARAQTQNGAEVLINITNDAWFGMSSAPYQHLGMAVFRAVENGRPLLRSANTGISAVISSSGEILARSSLFTEESITYEVPPGPFSKTIYTRYGDSFALFLSLVSIITVLYRAFFRKPRARPGTK